MEHSGFECSSCSTADQAYELLKQDSNFDILLSDIRTPGELDGADLAQLVMIEFPSMRIVLASGDESPLHLAGCKFLRKPFRFAELNEILCDLMSNADDQEHSLPGNHI